MTCPVCNDSGSVMVLVYRDAGDLPFGHWETRPCSAPSCVVAAVHRAEVSA
jgi:hypothetical protein